ncbi:MAG: rRNA cytosine-C5-methyltransferase [Elusimicrobiaceae bacterium]|nr:rRNA cytosine-C5-methyltransferase [Elusimicrobiaceae bacterium]
MNLPKEFITYTSALFGAEMWQRFLSAFEGETLTSIRLNPWKLPSEPIFKNAQPVPWCKNGFWLNKRPNFTLDPLLHAGAYYVQEAGSMFLDQVLHEHIKTPVLALDLCAAPGGKSTLMRAVLPSGSMLVSNEVDRKRASILLENMQKQGHADVLITHNYPQDFNKTHWLFDVILVDAPCSGEGLFRRDKEAIKEWSLNNVLFCQKRQRQILKDIWPCLKEGGLLIYSTCTFNTRENEENVKFIKEELGAEILPVSIKPEWHIAGSLLKGWQEPVYRFIPGTTKSEGLFMAVLRKKGSSIYPAILPSSAKKHAASNKLIHLLYDGNPLPEQKGKEQIPTAAQALSLDFPKDKYSQVDLTLEQAQHYLHREALILPKDTPKGFFIVCYQNQALGFVKNLGDRANNLYPKNWAIKSL